jgi:4-amino-4-deoxy-L-arabinose transferase-like glycosyltransferase
MKPVRLPASATLALPRWGLLALCLLYILPGLLGRDPWKNEDAAGFGVMWTMAHGAFSDWLWPHIVGLPHPEEGPLAFWIGALFIKAFGWLLGDPLAARMASGGFFLLGSLAVWNSTYRLGGRSDAQPLRLAFGGQPEPTDYGRTLADGALLIYLGCLGLLQHSHETSANALAVSLVACAIYCAVRFFESLNSKTAALLGATLGALTLTRGWVVPLAMMVGLLALALYRDRKTAWRLAAVSLPVALLVAGSWLMVSLVVQPFNGSPAQAWMDWNLERINLPTWGALQYLFKDSVWFAWPAWPFAAWAVYAWRRQGWPLHIALPTTFFLIAAVLALLDPQSGQGLLLPLLPPLAILAAFGLPTMKRGAINAVDWFSVMTLTFLAGVMWLYYIAKQSGWPPAMARGVFRLVPGFKPEIHWLAVAIAIAVTAGWIFLVHWRISRRPSVLWRAVVLSSGGVILIWVLLMTLFLDSVNYSKSYAVVAGQIAHTLPPGAQCVDSNVGPAQRASFAYFGHVPFAEFDGVRCDFLLLQDNHPKSDSAFAIDHAGSRWMLVWEGRRLSDRDERFRLYKRD